jgi:hypothetical protein
MMRNWKSSSYGRYKVIRCHLNFNYTCPMEFCNMAIIPLAILDRDKTGEVDIQLSLLVYRLSEEIRSRITPSKYIICS